MRLEQHLLAAPALLHQRDRGALHLFGLGEISSTSSMRAGLRNSIVIERTTKAKPGASCPVCLEQRAMVGADQAQIIGASALHVAQIIGVIDDAGEIGVFVIDADGHRVTAVAHSPSRSGSHAAADHAPRAGSRPPIRCRPDGVLGRGMGVTASGSTWSRVSGAR